jgi:hypothetical protein
MPAPTPIQIRYGPSGLLGQAVSLAASRGAQQDQDYQFINSMTQHKNRMDEALLDDGIQSRQLQLAHSYRVSQEQNPDQGSYFSGASNPGAIDAANLSLKNTYLTSAEGDLPQDQASRLRSLIGNRNISPEQFRSVLFDATKKAKVKTDEDTELASRRNYVKAASQGFSPEDTATLNAMAEDKNVNIGQIRTAADVIKNRNTAIPRARLASQTHGIDDQIRSSQKNLENLRRGLIKTTTDPDHPDATVDPETATPASLNPTYANATTPTGRSMGAMDAVKDIPGVPGHGSLVSGGVPPAVWAQYVAYQKEKQNLDALRNRRNQLVSGAGGQPVSAQPTIATAPASAASGGSLSLSTEGGWPVAEDQGKGIGIASEGGVKQVTPEIAAQFLQLARGDKNAARQMATQQGYSF